MGRKRTFETISLYFSKSDVSEMELYRVLKNNVSIGVNLSGLIKQILYNELILKKKTNQNLLEKNSNTSSTSNTIKNNKKFNNKETINMFSNLFDD